MSQNVTREEWEVTGDPGHGFPPYRFVFGGPGEMTRDDRCPEARARDFMVIAANDWPWQRLRKRTITETSWEDVS